jgi:DnaJ-class molecular chaperone
MDLVLMIHLKLFHVYLVMGRNYFPTNWTIFYAKITCPSCSGKGNIKPCTGCKEKNNLYKKEFSN